VPKDILTVIRNSGARKGDLIYVRLSSGGVSIEGARLTTAPDLLGLKLEALERDEPLVAMGPETNEAFADFVIDAETEEPVVIKSRVAGTRDDGPVAYQVGEQTAARE